MEKLEQMIHVSKTLDGKLEAAAAELEVSDPVKAKAIRETRCSMSASARPIC